MTDNELTDIADSWFETQEFSLSEQEELQNSCHLSLDLNDATYNMPHDVMDENGKFMDKVLKDFTPWKVFRELWLEHERTVEMDDLIDQGYWSGSSELVSKAGSFMGDGLSFIHLTLYLGGSVRGAYSGIGVSRPIGQSVGDDLFLLRTTLTDGLRLLELLSGIGAKFSKINALSPDSATFCESYVVDCSDTDLYSDLEVFKNSIFGDLVFMDTIKGSALTGKSKVKVDGAKPFIGHAKLVTKQINWHPISFCKERAKIILWCRNYMDAVSISSNMASLPYALGGIELAIGTQVTDQSDRWKDICPYYERILTLDISLFLAYYILLQGIYKANPKGFEWSNDWEIIKDITKGISVVYVDDLEPYIGTENANKPFNWKLRHLRKEHKLVSIRELTDLLARREAFLHQWDGLIPKNFLTLYDKNAKRRANATWAIIKSEIQPYHRPRDRKIQEMADAFSLRLEHQFFRSDDPAIIEIFKGMPALEFDFNPMFT